ncbi:helix-turn-helix transcriptional regulator [Glycocaulis profundi]|nr:helix-turn-helix transcriptional regulator [Glycocaulis profundi]
MDIRQVFGLNLRRERLRAGLTQEALAVKVGVDRAHVSAMERGVQNITLLTLWHVAEALGIEPHDLLKGRGTGVSGQH